MSLSSITFKKVAHCSDGENQCASQSSSKRSNPKTLKTKNLRLIYFYTSNFFGKITPVFYFTKSGFQTKDLKFLILSISSFRWENPSFLIPRNSVFFFRELCLFSEGGSEAEVGAGFWISSTFDSVRFQGQRFHELGTGGHIPIYPTKEPRKPAITLKNHITLVRTTPKEPSIYIYIILKNQIKYPWRVFVAWGNKKKRRKRRYLKALWNLNTFKKINKKEKKRKMESPDQEVFSF